MDKILAQDEVDALLRGLSGGELEAETDIPEDDSGIVPLDLANQDRIIRGRMPVLEIINDRFARLCTNALTNAVRKRVELNPISIDMTKFGEFVRSLPVPTSINIFKMEPLRGNALIVVDARLVFSLVENIFGGIGSQPKIEGREFTRIEQAIVDRIIKIALQTMEDSWRPVHDIKMELVRSEINPQFAAIVPPSDVVVVINFEVELDSSIGSMVICLPYSTIEPIRSKLNANYQTERLEVDHAWVGRLKERLLETPVDLKVRVGGTQITGNQLLRLQVGDVLVLDTDVEELLPCTVAGVVESLGHPGHRQVQQGVSGHPQRRPAIHLTTSRGRRRNRHHNDIKPRPRPGFCVEGLQRHARRNAALFFLTDGSGPSFRAVKPPGE